MKNNRKWCYGMTENGKFHDLLDERWEALEKGEEMAEYEGLSKFYLGRIDKNNEVKDVEKIDVAKNRTSVNERIDVSDLNRKADKLGLYSSRKTHRMNNKVF